MSNNYIQLCNNASCPAAVRCFRQTQPPKFGKPGREFSGQYIGGVFSCLHYIDSNREHYQRTTGAFLKG